jgi:hypothetical protein
MTTNLLTGPVQFFTDLADRGMVREQSPEGVRMKAAGSSKAHAHTRHADCHRCGWNQPLTRVTRRQRAEFHSKESFRWLCDDCLVELTAASPGSSVDAGAGAHSQSRRSVA